MNHAVARGQTRVKMAVGKKRKRTNECSSLGKKKRKVDDDSSRTCTGEGISEKDTTVKQETQKKKLKKKKKRDKNKLEQQSGSTKKKKKASTTDAPVNGSASLLTSGQTKDVHVSPAIDTSLAASSVKKKDKHSKFKKHKSEGLRGKKNKKRKTLTQVTPKNDASSSANSTTTRQDTGVPTSDIGQSTLPLSKMTANPQKHKSDNAKRKKNKHKKKSCNSWRDWDYYDDYDDDWMLRGRPYGNDQSTRPPVYSHQARKSYGDFDLIHLIEDMDGNPYRSTVTERSSHQRNSEQDSEEEIATECTSHWKKKQEDLVEEITAYINDSTSKHDGLHLRDLEDPYANIHKKLIFSAAGKRRLAKSSKPHFN